MSRRGLTRAILPALLITGGCLVSVRAQQSPPDLSAMSIEALMNLQVTSVSRKSEPLSRAAAAVTVITQEDIRRSGATSIPELLRLVPGLDVAQMDASTWAITARGFNSQYAAYMLVLVDGRTVYDPGFNGVRWDGQDTVLEDIDRIEVICGPGAALWGQNAVNGVINITTKKASETQGGLVTLAAGNPETPETVVRYGGDAGPKGHYRVFGKYFDRQGDDLAAGAPASDGWHSQRLGFRGDWDLSDRDSLAITAGGYENAAHHVENRIVSLLPPVQQLTIDPVHDNGFDATLKWQRTFSRRSDLTLQLYHIYTGYRDTAEHEARNTSDIDFQYHVAIKRRHDLVWGLGLRYTIDPTSGTFRTSFTPRTDRNKTGSLFVQHEISLLPNRLRFVWGARFTDDDYTGPELQPDGRLMWTLRPNHALWLAISRPVGEPSFASTGLRLNSGVFPGPGGIPVVPALVGNPGIGDANVLSTQAGYRGQLHKRVNLGLAGYYSRYKGALTLDPGAPFLETDPAPTHLVLPINFLSALKGESFGWEVNGTWQINSRWRISPSYTVLWMDFRNVITGNAASTATRTGTSPRNQFQVHSYVDLPHSWEWDTFVYAVGQLPTDTIPAYTRVDARVGWHFAERASVSVVGQNLLQPRHFEFGPSTGNINATQIKRSGYAKLTWTF